MLHSCEKATEEKKQRKIVIEIIRKKIIRRHLFLIPFFEHLSPE